MSLIGFYGAEPAIFNAYDHSLNFLLRGILGV